MRSPSFPLKWCLLLALAVPCQAVVLPAFHDPFLEQNGAVFTRGGDPFPLRCLQADALLSLSPPAQDSLLDKAVLEGFNAVSFDCPLEGPQGLAPAFSYPDPGRLEAFNALLGRLNSRDLRAFPVLVRAADVAAWNLAFHAGPESFWTGAEQQKWQYFLLKQLGQATDRGGRPVKDNAAVGGWILYRGPLPGDAGDFERWARAQVFWMKGLAFRQLKGLALCPAGQSWEPAAQAESPTAAASAPDASPSAQAGDLSPSALAQEPGPQDQGADSTTPDAGGAAAAPAPAGEIPALAPLPPPLPDFDPLRRALQRMQAPTQLDFCEVWLGPPASEGQRWQLNRWARRDLDLPLVWRVDFAGMAPSALRDFTDPGGLAGLCSPLPGDPDSSRPLWSLKSGSTLVALRLREVSAGMRDGKACLRLLFNRPASCRVSWGKALPLKGRAGLDTALVDYLPLPGLKKGDLFLARVRADSEKWGRAAAGLAWYRVEPTLEKGRTETLGRKRRAHRPRAGKKPPAKPRPRSGTKGAGKSGGKALRSGKSSSREWEALQKAYGGKDDGND